MPTERVEPTAPPTIRLSDFLEHTRDQLTSQASGLLAPRYTAAHHADVMHRLRALGGNDYGEQRVGKTRVALATAYLAQATRILVVTPPHVVSTWAKKEIPAVWPNTTVFILKRLADFDQLRSLPTPCIVVLSREHAKLMRIMLQLSHRLCRKPASDSDAIQRAFAAVGLVFSSTWPSSHCARNLRIDSPRNVIRMAPLTNRSRMALAIEWPSLR